MAIKRDLAAQIENWLFKSKVIIIYGARQVGKTTLTKSLLEKYDSTDSYFNCEVKSVQNALENREPEKLRSFLGDSKLIVLDEAQKVKGIGEVLKLLIDTYPDLQIIATGSSSFSLADRTSEALTGRSIQFTLYPLSFHEIKESKGLKAALAKVEFYLRFGQYPEIASTATNLKDARVLIDGLAGTYLYQDVLEFENLRKPDLLFKLLQLLALQIGSEVSMNELGNTLGINRRTVERYIDLLEKSFVIFKLRSFSRNLRNEINKGVKIYFYDLGIRNSVVQQFQPIDLRQDIGNIWENFLVVERLKRQQNHQIFCNKYYWRTHQQKEVDYVEEVDGVLSAFEFKWSSRKKVKHPKLFLDTYPNSTFNIVRNTDFLDFVL